MVTSENGVLEAIRRVAGMESNDKRVARSSR